MLCHLSKCLLVLSLCTSICCRRFYMMENTELVNETEIKSRAIISKPTDCLGVCLFTIGCESFNVFHTFSGRLMCSLYAVTNGTLLKSAHSIHFTTNNSAKPKAFTEKPTRTTSGKEESFFLEKNINGTHHCVGSTLEWKAFNDHSNCQKFMFNNGVTMNFWEGECFGLDISGTFVKRTQPPSCSNLTYYDGTKQLQYNADINKCIEFFQNQDPRVHACDIGRGDYTKTTAN